MAASAETRAARAAADLDETEAVLVSLNHLQVLDAAGAYHALTRMTRKWAKIRDKNRAALEAVLKARTYELDPMADQETRSGRWKVMRVYSSPEKTDPGTQGIYEVLQYWPVGYDGGLGTYCAESSVLHHEDVESFFDAPAPADCAHAITPGTIYSATNGLDPETGLWRGELREDVARKPAKIAWETGGVLEKTARERQTNDSAAPAIAASTTPGTLISGQIDLNSYGVFDWDKSTETAQKPAAIVWTDGGPLASAAHTKQANDSTVPTIGAGAAGTNTSASVDLNRYGWFDWSKVVETATTPAAIVWETGGPLEKTTRTRQLNAAAAPTLAAGTAGFFKTGSIDLNRYGRFDWETAVEAAQKPAAVVWTDGGPLASAVHTEQANDSAVPTIGAGAAGTNTSGRVNLNRYGWFDWSRVVETAVTPAAITWTDGGPLVSTAHARQINGAAGPTIAAGAAGSNTSASIDLNRYGRFDWATATETAVAASTTWTESSKYEITNGLTFENQSALPAAPTATGIGTAIVRVQVSINRFGWLDGAISVTTATTGFSTESITLEDSYQQTVARKWYFNQATAPAGASKSVSGGDVTLKTYSPELNRFGLWDYSETTTTIRTGWSATSYHQYGEIYTIRTENDTMILYQRYKNRYTHTIAIHTTMAAAQAAISGKLDGSSTREIGGGLFMSDGVDVTEEFQNQVVVMK